MSEYERWEARFAVPEYAFGKQPNEFLKSCKHLLPPSGRALAVADGEGRNGGWLAEQEIDRFDSFGEFFSSMVNYNATIAHRVAGTNHRPPSG